MKLIRGFAHAFTRHGALWMSVCTIAGCSFEVENPGKPDPKPETGAAKKSPAGDSNMPNNDSGSTNPNTILTQKPSAVGTPTTMCNTAITRGVPNSAGKEGAVVALPAEVSSVGSLLVLRDTQSDRFLNAAEQLFSTGTFSLEFYAKDETSCRFEIAISSNDVSQKIKITVAPN